MNKTETNDASVASDRLYHPDADERQFTWRAVLVGCLVGSVVSCTNIYIGLKIGWTFGASIISAVLGFAVFRAFGAQLTVLETNITQTAGSAAGSMASAAGLVAAIPAMQLLGYELQWHQLIFWALTVAFLGVFFAVPLRRQVVVIDKLRFPTGTATAETILAMFSDAGEAVKKAKVLIYGGVCAGTFTLLTHFIPPIESPEATWVLPYLAGWSALGAPVLYVAGRTTLAGVVAAAGVALFGLHFVIPAAIFSTAAVWTFKMYFGPSLFGAGFLIGPRVCLSLLIGAVIAWAGLGPLAKFSGWAAGPVMDYKTGARGWLLWPGVALMVAEALTALALSWRTFARALTMSAHTEEDASDELDVDEEIPNSWWIGGLLFGSMITVYIANEMFDIAPWLSLIAIALSAVLAIVAVRSVGETDINPIGGMGKVTQLVYGALAPAQMTTNLMTAAITGAGASQAGDMMQDLKTGHLLGASPRKQFGAQLVGIGFGVVFVVPVYMLFSASYEIGGEKLPAPAAFAWKAMAEVLAKGLDALPPHATEAVAIAAVVGIVLPLLRKVPQVAKFVPSGLAMGIAFIIPAFYSLLMFYGMLGWLVWRRVAPAAVDKYNFALASGLVAGEGLIGIVNAALTILGVEPLVK